MTKAQRIFNIAAGIVMIISSIFLITDPKNGYIIVVILICVSLFIYGIRELLYYFLMARHMVGGRLILYIGIIILDAGIFTALLSDIPSSYVMLYLIVLYAVSGVIDILRAFEEKKLEVSAWKWKLAYGIVNLLISIAGIVFISNQDIAVVIYAAGLIYSGVTRIISSFRRTAVVYIQYKKCYNKYY